MAVIVIDQVFYFPCLFFDQTALANDKMSSRNSEMSLVSLTQSTGDLSSLDESSEQLENEKALGEEGMVEKKTADISREGVPQQGDKEEINPGRENNEDKRGSDLSLDLKVTNDVQQDRLPGALSPWHPLKPDLNVSISSREEDDLFLDASGTPNAEMQSQIPERNVQSQTHTDTMHKEELFVEEGNLQAKQQPSDSSLHDAIPSNSIDVMKINVAQSEPPDSSAKVETQNSVFEEISEAVVEVHTPGRPSNLDLEQDYSMTSVDLTTSDHELGKPTLRQLAEMKEFDKSPSLEDTNGVLPEERLAAWLPSVETRHVIDAVNRGVPADRNCLTFPSVLLETCLVC